MYLFNEETNEKHFAEMFCFSKNFVEQRVAILNTLSKILDFKSHCDSVSNFIKKFHLLRNSSAPIFENKSFCDRNLTQQVKRFDFFHTP